jgi:Bacterial Ig domain
MDRNSIRHKIGVGIVFAGLAAGVLAHPAAAVNLPVAVDDVYLVDASQTPYTSASSVLANDTGSGNGALTAVLVQNPSNGTVDLHADGTFLYTPIAAFTHGTDVFNYQASDGGGKSNLASVYITLDSAPMANPDSYATAKNTPLTVPADGVLANDTDVDGDALAATLLSQPINGKVLLNADGSFTYTPDAGYQGGDFFSYQTSDGFLLGGFADVYIAVGKGNNAPLGVDDHYSTHVDIPLIIPAPGVLSNDIDTDNDPLQAVVLGNPVFGAWTLNADGSFIYTPKPGYIGDDVVSYVPFDGSLYGGDASVVITILPASTPTPAPPQLPIAVDDVYSTAFETALKVGIPGVLSNDIDPSNTGLGAWLQSSPSHGKLDYMDTDGKFAYLPDAGFSGADSFTYYVENQDGDSQLAAVTINVGPPSDTPAPQGTPSDETSTPTPTDSPGDETATPTPTDTTGDESSTPAPTDTPGVPTSSDDPTPAPPVATQDSGSDVGGVTTLPVTGAGPASDSSGSNVITVLAILGLGGFSLALRRVNKRRTR